MPSPVPRPLEGVRVVAMEQAVSLPYCTFMLAELGAEVIKIERLPAGDVIRGWDDVVHGISTGYVWVNSNKRSLGLDLKQPEAREIVLELVESADVFAENFAPGVAGRLGVGFDDIRARRPQIVYCSISGYGQTGPYAHVKAFDLLIQGESGLINVSGGPDSPAKVGIPVTDLIAGSNAVIAILAALQQRDRTAEAQYLDIAMLDSTMPWLGYYPHHIWHGGSEPIRTGMHHQYIVPYGPYEAADGTLVNVAIADDRQWRIFCDVVAEEPELGRDERFATVVLRNRNRDELMPTIERIFRVRPAQEWIDRLQDVGIPCGLVRSIEGAINHPQVDFRGLRVEAETEFGPVPVFRAPFAFSEGGTRRIPSLGESTDGILADLGYAESDIARLRAAAAVGGK